MKDDGMDRALVTIQSIMLLQNLPRGYDQVGQGCDFLSRGAFESISVIRGPEDFGG